MWTVIAYDSTSLFSLKISSATSSGGKSLLVPTPYAAKMAFLNAAFRAGLSDEDCARLCRELSSVHLRIGVPARAVVTQTFVKVRQENRDVRRNPTEPYKATITYRELVHLQGSLKLAFTAAGELSRTLRELAPLVNYFGKRGSFFQFLAVAEQDDLGIEFTQPIETGGTWRCPARAHLVPADDFGPDASLAVLSSFADARPVREKHRAFVTTVVPLGVVNTGPGFVEYARE